MIKRIPDVLLGLHTLVVAGGKELDVIIDCDVHQNFACLEALLPYLPPAHREHLTGGGYSGMGLPTYL